MIDEKTVIEMISATSQDECRQLAELFKSFAGSPRDVHWKSQMRRSLALFPDPPKSDLTVAIEAGRARVREAEDALWAEGWHPTQMRAKLEALGYIGAEQPEITPAN